MAYDRALQRRLGRPVGLDVLPVLWSCLGSERHLERRADDILEMVYCWRMNDCETAVERGERRGERGDKDYCSMMSMKRIEEGASLST